ncbi:hypothetical protein RB195_004408 [Necator americanus]|uniref:Fork-head domain-containing protein n=1 Tax=Necator americanus TaxID=51031 RepID=A0ABR1BHU7_NECAM
MSAQSLPAAASPPAPLAPQPPLPSSGSSSASSSIGQLGVAVEQQTFMSAQLAPGTTPASDDSGEEMGPLSRDRCNTWPMRRPQLDVNAQTSPLIHEQIPEEDGELYDSAENLNGRLGATSAASSAALLHSPDGNNTFSPSSCNMSSPVMNDQITPTGATDAGDSGTNAGASKKSTTRRNAWGNLSYADLITQAILQSPEKRLTLSQVYEWMVQNVPYFRDKGDSNSSAGWKRHIGYVSLERERERRPSRPLKWPLCRGSFDRSLVYRTALAGCSPSEGLRVVKSSLALWQLSSKNDRDGLPGRGDL